MELFITKLTPRITNNDKEDNSSSSGAKTSESFEKVARDAGLNPDQALDYREVDQGRNVEAKLETTVKPKNAKNKGNKTKNGSKGEGGTGKKSSFNKRTIRQEARCSFCGNQMTQSENMNWHELTGYKIPKRADNKTPAFKSPPGAPSGKVVAVFCDNCENALNSGTTYRDFRTAVVEREDGTIENIPVTSLTA